MTVVFRTEEQCWDMLLTDSEEARCQKARLDRNRAIIRQQLMAYGGLRRYALALASHIEYGGKMPSHPYLHNIWEIHPDALSLLGTFGIEYSPMMWTAPPPIVPMENECYLNAYWAMRSFNREAKQERSKDRLICVQGIKIGQEMVLHGWNARTVCDEMAIDISQFAFGLWAFYLGLPLTEEEYWKARRLVDESTNVHWIMTRETFPFVRKYLFEVIGNRLDFQHQQKAA